MYSKDIIKRYNKTSIASVADACEHVFGKYNYMTADMKNRINDKRFAGPAVTVVEGLVDGTNPPTLAIDAIEGAKNGDVLVIGFVGDATDVALLGGLMAAGAMKRGMAGVVLDGGVRDVTEIRRDYQLPVCARSITPGSTVGRYGTLSSNVPVTCGGILVSPGDLIVSDVEGVIVVPQEHVMAVLEDAESIDVREAAQTKIILESGSLQKGLDAYNRI